MPKPRLPYVKDGYWETAYFDDHIRLSLCRKDLWGVEQVVDRVVFDSDVDRTLIVDAAVSMAWSAEVDQALSEMDTWLRLPDAPAGHLWRVEPGEQGLGLWLVPEHGPVRGPEWVRPVRRTRLSDPVTQLRRGVSAAAKAMMRDGSAR